MKNKSEFKNTESIEKWIESVYSELPRIATMNGCFSESRDSKELVSKYAKLNN